MNQPLKASSPQHHAIGGPLPVLLDFRNGGRSWRMSLGALVQATLLGLVLLLPLLSTDPLTSPPVREWISPPIWKGDAHGDPEVKATGGRQGEKKTPKPNLADVRLVFPEVSVDRPDVPAIGPGNGNGSGDGPSRLGDPSGPDHGVQPLPNVVPPPTTTDPPKPKEPVRVGGVVRPPRLIHRVEPAYPVFAKRAGIQGEVVMEAVLGEDGRVREITIKSGHPSLAPAARDAVSQWVYEPTLLNGEPYPVVLEVKVRFYLNR